jgi:hypothetical protein
MAVAFLPERVAGRPVERVVPIERGDHDRGVEQR